MLQSLELGVGQLILEFDERFLDEALISIEGDCASCCTSLLLLEATSTKSCDGTASVRSSDGVVDLFQASKKVSFGGTLGESIGDSAIVDVCVLAVLASEGTGVPIVVEEVNLAFTEVEVQQNIYIEAAVGDLVGDAILSGSQQSGSQQTAMDDVETLRLLSVGLHQNKIIFDRLLRFLESNGRVNGAELMSETFLSLADGAVEVTVGLLSADRVDDGAVSVGLGLGMLRLGHV